MLALRKRSNQKVTSPSAGRTFRDCCQWLNTPASASHRVIKDNIRELFYGSQRGAETGSVLSFPNRDMIDIYFLATLISAIMTPVVGASSAIRVST